eukprot:GGOE01061328.1.p1 GENE.GGOE01061328.1~~GGOE01061328.1.p1  ORF type:complete len:303 (-),score=76.42 GGOE01061328.1:178-1059(-)
MEDPLMPMADFTYSSQVKAIATKCKLVSNSKYLEDEAFKLEQYGKLRSLNIISPQVRELEEEIIELQALLEDQPKVVQGILLARVAHLQASLDILHSILERTPTSSVSDPRTAATQQTANESTQEHKDIATFPAAFDLATFLPFKQWGWDQSSSFVTVYLTLDGLVDQAQVHCGFQRQSFDFRCIHCAGKHFRLYIPALCMDIVPSESSVVVKTGSARIKLRKADMKEWCGLDDTEKRKKAQHKQLADSGATTEELLRNMYLQADDKTREDLTKAAAEGQKKRAESAKVQGFL